MLRIAVFTAKALAVLVAWRASCTAVSLFEDAMGSSSLHNYEATSLGLLLLFLYSPYVLGVAAGYVGTRWIGGRWLTGALIGVAAVASCVVVPGGPAPVPFAYLRLSGNALAVFVAFAAGGCLCAHRQRRRRTPADGMERSAS
jgi:hypothetical protein